MLNIARNPAATWPTVQRAYQNGDSASTGTLEDPFQDACDADDYLKARIEAAAGELGVSGVSITRVMRGEFTSAEGAGVAGFTPNANGSASQVGSGAFAVYPLEIPHGATLTAVAVVIKGATGHAAFPGGAPTMPTIDVQSISTSAAVVAVSGTITDTSATAGAYEAAHTLTASGLSTVIDRATKRYYVRLAGEAGGNFIAGLLAYTVSATWTPA